MKCPKCELALSSSRDLCPRCGLDLRSHKRRLKIRPTRAAVIIPAQTGKNKVSAKESRQTKILSTDELASQLQEMPMHQQGFSSESDSLEPKKDLSDLLDALNEIRGDSTSSDASMSAQGEQEVLSSGQSKVPTGIYSDFSEELAEDALGEDPLPLSEEFCESIKRNIQEAKDATESLAETESFEPQEESTTTFKSRQEPLVSPEVVEFGEDGDDGFDEKLDEMIGDLVFDVEAVKVEKKEVKSAAGDDSLFYDDVEISFEIEVDGEIVGDDDDDSYDEEQEVEQSDEPDQLLDGLVKSLDAFESGTQQVDINAAEENSVVEAEVVDLVEAPKTTEKAGVLPDSVRATLRAAQSKNDPSVKRLAALLAESYGVDPEALLKPESIETLSSELDSELDALLGEGTSFYGEQESAEEVAIEEIVDEGLNETTIMRLQSELADELAALEEDGTNFLNTATNEEPQGTEEQASLEAEASAQVEEVDSAELALLQDELLAELAEFESEQFTDDQASERIEQRVEESPLELSEVYSKLDDTLKDLDTVDSDLEIDVPVVASSDDSKGVDNFSRSIIQTGAFLLGDLRNSNEDAIDAEQPEPTELSSKAEASEEKSEQTPKKTQIVELSDDAIAELLALDPTHVGETPEEASENDELAALEQELSDLEQDSTQLEQEQTEDRQSDDVPAAPLEEAVQTGRFLIQDLADLKGLSEEPKRKPNSTSMLWEKNIRTGNTKQLFV